MIYYEVDVTLSADIKETFHDWLQEHVKKMLSFKGFSDARILEVLDSNGCQLSCRYSIESLADFEQMASAILLL